MGFSADMDADADGKFSEAELSAALAKRATNMDANSDGFIDSVEVEAYHVARKAERREARFARMSESLDANNDGKLSVDEFAAGAHDRMMKRDRNGDGVIERGEGRGGQRRGQRPPMPPQN
jgi:Ca2+-binding EF-hand superfamily protein